jgi:hypothetical protein
MILGFRKAGSPLPSFLNKSKENDVENEEGIGLCRLPDNDTADDIQQ